MRTVRLLIALACAALAAPILRAEDLLLAGFGANTIYRYNGVSATPFATDPDPTGPDSSATKMHGPTAMAYDASNNLLVLNEFSKNVLKFDGTSGTFIGNFISAGTLGGAGVTDPDDMEIGSDGNLYITGHGSVGGTNIHRFNGTTGAYLGPFSTIGTDRHQHGLTFGLGGDLFQGAVDAKAVERYNGITGASMGTFASGPTSGPFTMFPIADVAFGPSNLYVTVDGTAGVARFSIAGAFLDYLPGTARSAYWGILVDGGFQYVSNLSTGSIRKFNAADGTFVSDTVLGGGAFDILPVAPEPHSIALLALFACLRQMRFRRRG